MLDIAKKIVEANLPSMVTKTTLPTLRADALREVIATKGYQNDLGLVSYILSPTKSTPLGVRSATLAAVMGKELLLSGVPIAYQPLAGLLREVKLLVDPHEFAMSAILQKRGKGYWVITDFDDQNSHPSTAVWHDALDIIQSHVNRGGGVILACADKWKPSAEVYSGSFLALATSFTVLDITA